MRLLVLFLVVLVVVVIVLMVGGCYLFFLPGEYDDMMKMMRDDELKDFRVLIEHPEEGKFYNSNDIEVRGRVSSVRSIKEVWMRLGNSGVFGKASGTSSWSSNLSGLSEGTNTVYVYAVDNAGNTSSTQSVSFIVVLRVYVSTGGNDANDGILKTIPVRSIQVGLSKARGYNVNEIYITTGLYTPGSGLNSSGSDSGVVITNNNIRLIGGWDSGFNSMIGYSEL
ncbi:MAG: hypothetical protein RMJ37_03490, partial [Spirochaetia bacterium]|nr:hypothetical protein [Spirochaetota bacterium]MDW8112391.1 hypothetical protein [Spirochaetia bacterium]